MKEFQISKLDANQRIDKYIKKLLPNISLSLLYKTFRKKDIKINNHRVKQDYLLKENDILKIYLDDSIFLDALKEKEVYEIKHNFDIIYEDQNILIINKDKGILIHGDKNEKVYTLSNEVISYLYSKGEYDPKKDNFIPSPVHRLDRNTSGICVFSKNLQTSKILMEEFKNKVNLEKRYIALVFGKTPNKGIIKAPLIKDSNKNLVKVDFNNKEAKEALTEYYKIDGNDNYSLVNVNLITGRTHQIRVHLSYIHYPLVGDAKYGNFLLNKEFNKKFNYEKQFLHAYSLKFKNLDNELRYLSNKVFIANLKKDELKILENLSLKYKNINE